jgi:hypothetical protein
MAGISRSNWISFSKGEFETVIENYAKTWQMETQIIGGEYVYDLKMFPNLCMRIYSSISPETGQCKPLGADAIRIVMVWKGKPVMKKQSRVYRTTNWRFNLVKRMGEVMKNFEEIYTPAKFGAHLLIEKNGRLGRFMGCIDYKNGCRYTEAIK